VELRTSRRLLRAGNEKGAGGCELAGRRAPLEERQNFDQS